MVRWRVPSRPQRSGPRVSENPSDPSWPSLLGRKVSLRYRLHDDPDHPFSEAIGVVLSVHPSGSDEVVSLMDRKGRTIEIAASDVVARKVFET